MPTFFTLTQGKAERRSKNEKKKDMTFDFKAVHKSKAGCFLSRQIGFPSSLLPSLQDSNFDKEVIDVVRVDGKDCWYCATTGLQYDLQTNGDWRKAQMVSPAISLQISAHSRSATQHDGRLA